MAERITLTREQMGFGRRTADRVAGAGNIVEIGVIGVGVITANPVLIGGGIASWVLGKEVQNEWIRKKTVNKGAGKDGLYMKLPPKGNIFAGKKKQ